MELTSRLSSKDRRKACVLFYVYISLSLPLHFYEEKKRVDFNLISFFFPQEDSHSLFQLLIGGMLKVFKKKT